MAALAQYCDQRGVPWLGFDLDPEHATFSRLFPEEVILQPLGDEPEAEVIKIFRRCTETPVTLIDPRAHLSDVVLRGWDMIRFPEQFSAQGGRITTVVFPGDDLEILTDIDGLVSRLGDKVDYLVVRNPARQPRSRMFDGSPLEDDLKNLGAAFLELPHLLAVARNHLSALEAELGRGITHLEAVANRELPLDGMIRLVVEDWIRTSFRRFDQVADKLLPTEYAAKITRVDTATVVSAPRITRGAKINKTNL
ncbi:MAG: ATPase [Verrucomicrobia bacterium]|nr:ATPase [Verrucomicrobiota bacterium]